MSTLKKHQLGLGNEARRVYYTATTAANTMYIAGQFMDYNNNPCREKVHFKTWISTAFSSFNTPTSASCSMTISLASGTITRTYATTAAGNQYALEGFSDSSGYFTIAYSSAGSFDVNTHILINGKYLIHIPSATSGTIDAFASSLETSHTGWGE